MQERMDVYAFRIYNILLLLQEAWRVIAKRNDNMRLLLIDQRGVIGIVLRNHPTNDCMVFTAEKTPHWDFSQAQRKRAEPLPPLDSALSKGVENGLFYSIKKKTACRRLVLFVPLYVR